VVDALQGSKTAKFFNGLGAPCMPIFPARVKAGRTVALERAGSA
jgi:hypothetical protein